MLLSGWKASSHLCCTTQFLTTSLPQHNPKCQTTQKSRYRLSFTHTCTTHTHIPRTQHTHTHTCTMHTTYSHIHTHKHTHTHTYIHKYARAHARTHARAHARTHTHTHTNIYIYMQTHSPHTMSKNRATKKHSLPQQNCIHSPPTQGINWTGHHARVEGGFSRWSRPELPMRTIPKLGQ